MSQKEDLLLLYDRPIEPSFTKRGPQFDTQLVVPSNYLTQRYQSMAEDIANRFSEDVQRQVYVKKITLPNLEEVKKLGRKENFSIWIPRHRELAGRLIDVFMGAKSYEDLLAMAVYAKEHVNPYLFQYSYTVALLHRPDTKDLRVPNFAETQPEKFIDSSMFRNIREEALIDVGNRLPIEIPRDYTASDLDVEHRLWYFREDLGINIHHWHWHVIYPVEGANRSIVAKDRRGEIFYYMHQQINARYNFERFCNNLQRVERFNNFRDPLKEGYFPKMDSLVASRAWPARTDNMILQDLNREADQLKTDVATLERWRDRIFEAIHQGYAVDPAGAQIPLQADDSTDSGIDLLGNMVDSTVLSVNRLLYGDLHGQLHTFISYMHDPNNKYLESFGVMGDPNTTMRDPAFYRMHAFIDDIFQEYKETLPSYTTQQLTFTGITVDEVQVQSQGSNQMNTFNTFWQKSDLNISRGLEFLPHGDIFIRFTHIQHAPFTYIIQVTNSSEVAKLGMVRIYLAPKNDERGTSFLMRDQRLLFIEMDKFIAQINPGTNIIRHSSFESTVTVPYERTFSTVQQEDPVDRDAKDAFNFCGCGWPDHALVPKGTPEGFPCELFVMVSDYEQDKVDQDLVGNCNDAASYCGLRDRLYPDRRPMGYPFDRVPRANSDRLATFLTPNMKSTECRIFHEDQVKNVKPIIRS